MNVVLGNFRHGRLGEIANVVMGQSSVGSSYNRDCIGRGVAAVRAVEPNGQTFVRYALASVVTELPSLQLGSTLPRIDSRVIRSGEVIISVPREQERIGEALSDADDLIASLERMIAKKQEIKQGLMQQLLIGRVRLPIQEDTV